jgi:hypothetical protein
MKTGKTFSISSVIARIIFCLIGLGAVIAIFFLLHIGEPIVDFILKTQDLAVFTAILIIVIFVYKFLKNRKIL